jgi:hypothetical protein
MFQGLPLPVWAKFTFCVAADLFDMTVGRIMLGVGTFGDVGNALVMFLLWGPLGLLSIWEAADVTEQLDGFIPTNTIIAWIAHKKHGESAGA